MTKKLSYFRPILSSMTQENPRSYCAGGTAPGLLGGADTSSCNGGNDIQNNACHNGAANNSGKPGGNWYLCEAGNGVWAGKLNPTPTPNACNGGGAP